MLKLYLLVPSAFKLTETIGKLLPLIILMSLVLDAETGFTSVWHGSAGAENRHCKWCKGASKSSMFSTEPPLDVNDAIASVSRRVGDAETDIDDPTMRHLDAFKQTGKETATRKRQWCHQHYGGGRGGGRRGCLPMSILEAQRPVLPHCLMEVEENLQIATQSTSDFNVNFFPLDLKYRRAPM